LFYASFIFSFNRLFSKRSARILFSRLSISGFSCSFLSIISFFILLALLLLPSLAVPSCWDRYLIFYCKNLFWLIVSARLRERKVIFYYRALFYTLNFYLSAVTSFNYLYISSRFNSFSRLYSNFYWDFNCF